MTDTRIVCGARCTWWDSIGKVGHIKGNTHSLPVCPHCGSVLYEYDNEAKWFAGVDAYNEEHPGYRKLVEWARGRCFRNFQQQIAAYTADTGIKYP